MNKTIILRSMVLGAVVVTATVFGISSCSNTQKQDDTKEVAKEHNDAKFNDTNNEDDAKFLVNAAEISLEEIKLGQLAQNKTTMVDVKELGKMMEADHTKSLNELKTLADKKSITLPASITDEGTETYKKLSDKSGNDFDKEYCDKMVKGHKDAIEKFEKASTDSYDSEIRDWATATLGTLRMHLDHAITCQKKQEMKM